MHKIFIKVFFQYFLQGLSHISNMYTLRYMNHQQLSHVLLLYYYFWCFSLLLTGYLTSNVGISMNVICDLNAFQCHSSVTNLVEQYLHNLDIITSNIIIYFYTFLIPWFHYIIFCFYKVIMQAAKSLWQYPFESA